MLLHCGEVLKEARFIEQSLPNVEATCVEQVLRQIYTAHRRDSLEFFRTIFLHLEQIGLLDMESSIHRVCLFLTYHLRIQHSLDETVTLWNLHKIRMAGNNREHAINSGYWTGDPGDSVEEATDPHYGDNEEESFPPADKLQTDPTAPNYDDFADPASERDEGICINADEEIEAARRCLDGIDFNADDGNFGIDVYCSAVMKLTALGSA
ncbi:hypothetical protein BDN70DRAFT_908769 [Pholiota conissans]|uniref:Integrase core domain-containing protein n=1 Tax=Pholiota conissans TaxID=109636 RepID=A0A9P6CPB8_9AGAR|nr:hypothetical protein BDN70DRAFT_908769 [Pholiota conissans]